MYVERLSTIIINMLISCSLSMKIKFKKDRFKSARGSNSKLLNLSCRKCGEAILKYQKDGSGNLRRLYLDRIFSPENLKGLQAKPLNEIQLLRCPKCKAHLGTPYIYKQENRKAFRIDHEAITKKIGDLKDA